MNIDRHDRVVHSGMCQLIAKLRAEISVDATFRVSTVDAANVIYGLKASTTEVALEEMLLLYKETYGREYGR